LDRFDLVYDGRCGIAGCAWSMQSVGKDGFDVWYGQSLAQQWLAGSRVSATGQPKRFSCEAHGGQLGVSRDLAGLLLDDPRQAIKVLSSGRVSNSVSRQLAGGYHHN